MDAELLNIVDALPDNDTIYENMVKAYLIINDDNYEKIVCSVSGGADSDVMIDICTKCDKDNKIDYVWFDTGIEYEATKRHLSYLEDRYNISIKHFKPKKSIPRCCKEYGQPFISKLVSEFISRLQRHNFKFEDRPFEELIIEYPNCKSALEWWCGIKGEGSKFGIQRNIFLKEFMVENPPQFKISNICCKYSKKDVIKSIINEGDYDLNIFGVRRSEGGARQNAYKSCYDTDGDVANYRPLFWYSDKDRICYEQHYGIKHSDAYEKYLLRRTGCCGCPFGRDFEIELNALYNYEPKMYRTVNSIFKESYSYLRQYIEYRDNMRSTYGTYTNYLQMKTNNKL